MLFGLFEKYSTSGQNQKFAPIYIKANPVLIFDKIVKKLQDEGYEVKASREYFDIYHEDNGFEISHLINQDDNGRSYVNVSVYGEHKRGATRRKLKKELQQVENLFNE